MNRNVVTIALAAVAAIVVSTTGHTQENRWKAAAISKSGHQVYYAWGRDEYAARHNALDKCRDDRGGCEDDPTKSISVESWWWLVVADCNGRKFVGGSQWNGDVALDNAKAKAPRQLRDSCFQDGEGLAGTVPPNYQGQGQGDIDARRRP
jgi:hypothetical protein